MRWWYRDLREGRPDIPPRADLDEGKRILYAARRLLRETMGGDAYPEELQQRLRDCFPTAGIGDFLAEKGLEPAASIGEREQQLTQVVDDVATFQHERLGSLNQDLFGQLSVLAENWADTCRRDLIVRYLGFPLWDVLLYPFQTPRERG